MTDMTLSADQPGRPLPPARPRIRPVASPPAARLPEPAEPDHTAEAEPVVDAASTPKPDYAIGYGKPPKHTQFKPGQSGNPRGRPRRAKGVNTIIREQMLETVLVKTPSGPKRMSTAEVLVRRLREKGLAGDLRSILQLLGLLRQACPDPVLPEPSDGPSTDDLTAGDQAVLNQLQALLQAGSAAPVGERP